VNKELQRVLREAVEDILAHGYDSQKRIQLWAEKLHAAALRALIPEAEINRRLAEELGLVYERQFKGDKFMRRHQGLSRFTVEQLKPKLRNELDKRVLASANLIRLNREASIQRTLQRFEGWATSVPAGGRRGEAKAPLDKKLRRAFASLPYEERRVIVDQGHKLVAAVNTVVANDGGAVAGIWHSHFRETGYDARPRHMHFDSRVFVLRGNWALRDGLMKLDGALYTDQLEAPAELINCRCYYSYIYNLADLPVHMLTAKAKAAMLQRGERHAAYG
jgi:hypothetical protein